MSMVKKAVFKASSDHSPHNSRSRRAGFQFLLTVITYWYKGTSTPAAPDFVCRYWNFIPSFTGLTSPDLFSIEKKSFFVAHTVAFADHCSRTSGLIQLLQELVGERAG